MIDLSPLNFLLKLAGSISTFLAYLACVAAKGMVTYVKRAYPRTDGNVYYTFINSESNTITIGLTDPHSRDIIIGENVKCRKRVET